MKNLEQTLAQTLLAQYPRHRPEVDYDYVLGLRIAYKIIAKSIFGKEIAGDTDLEFIENLEKIANSEPQANLVEITRYEAFRMHKYYQELAKDYKSKGHWSLEDEYNIKSNKWIDIACEIEKSDADGLNEHLIFTNGMSKAKQG